MKFHFLKISWMSKIATTSMLVFWYSVCLCLFVYSNTTSPELQTVFLFLFSKIWASKLGVRLIHGYLQYNSFNLLQTFVLNQVWFSLHIYWYTVLLHTYPSSTIHFSVKLKQYWLVFLPLWKSGPRKNLQKRNLQVKMFCLGSTAQ